MSNSPVYLNMSCGKHSRISRQRIITAQCFVSFNFHRNLLTLRFDKKTHYCGFCYTPLRHKPIYNKHGASFRSVCILCFCITWTTSVFTQNWFWANIY